MMTKMRKLFFYLLFAGILTPAIAQEINIHARPECDETLNEYSFDGAFAIYIREDGVSNYYLVDGTLLSSRFERVYFMEQSFASSEIINMGFNPDCDRICFKADKQYVRPTIIARLAECKEKARQISREWCKEQQVKWLQEHDKYK